MFLPHRRYFRNTLITTLAACFTGLVFMPSARAATETWVGNTSALFNAANWSGTNNPPLAGDSLVFGAAGLAGTTLTDDLMTTAFNIAGITFNAGAAAFIINPNTAGTNGFTLTGNVTNNSTSLQTINDKIAMTAVRTFTTKTGGGDLTLGGIISGTGGGIAKAGLGTLTLKAANTYTGATTVSAGTLEMATGGSITTSVMTVGSLSGDNGTLNITGGAVSTSATSFIGTSAGSSGTATVSSGTLTITNTLNVGGFGTGVLNVTGGAVTSTSFTVGQGSTGSGTVTISSGSIATSGGSVTVGSAGTGVLNISATGAVTTSFTLKVGSSSTSTGVVNLTGGTLQNTGVGTLGSVAGGSGTVNVSGGTWTTGTNSIVGSAGIGVLNLTGGTVKVGGTAGTGTLTLGGSAGGSGTLNLGTGGTAGTLNAATVTGGSGTAVVNFNQTGSYTFAKNLTGTLAVNKLGAGTTVLTGTVANTYTGATTISAGTLQIGNGSTTGSLSTSSAITNNATLAFNRSDTLTQGTDFNSVISGSGAVTQAGSGTLVLNGANTYTGATTISAGTLRFAQTAALYNGTTANWTNTKITASSGSTLAMNVGGTGEFTTGNVTTLLGSLTTSINNNGLQAGSSIGFDTTNAAGGSFTVADTIADSTGTGAGSLGVTKLGVGTLVLNGTNTYSGGTTLSAGTLLSNNSTGSATGSGGIVVDAGAVLAGTGRVNAGSNTITINGTVTIGDTTLGSPVASSFTLGTIGGSGITLGATGALRFDLFSGAGAGNNTASVTASDLLILYGDISLLSGAQLLIDNPNNMSAWAIGDQWRLWDVTNAGTRSGSFALASILGPALSGIQMWKFDSQTGILSIVPEPGRASLLFLGLCGLLLRRRRK